MNGFGVRASNNKEKIAVWIIMNDSTLSIVNKNCAPDELLVRARKNGDTEKVFPAAQVMEDTGTDYRFRARVSRSEIAAAVAERIMEIDSGNFKNSVQEHDRHMAYVKTWNALLPLQRD